MKNLSDILIISAGVVGGLLLARYLLKPPGIEELCTASVRRLQEGVPQEKLIN